MEEVKIDFSGIQPVDKEIKYADELPGINSNFLRVPEVGESIVLVVKGLQEDTSPRRLNKADNSEWHTGFKDKRTGDIISWNIITDKDEVFNLKSAMLYYGVGNKLKEYAKAHPGLKPPYAGAKLKITHNYDGFHANMKLQDLQKIKGFATLEEAQAYQNEVKQAMKEFRIYTVELLN